MGDAGARITLMNVPIRKSLFLLSIVAIVVSGFAQPVLAKSADSKYQFFNLSLPDFKLYTAEQVTGFSCTVLGGGIAQVSVPFQWDVSVDSSIGDRATLTASSNHGADAFYQPDLAPFHDNFMAVFRDPLNVKILSFEVTFVLTITNNETGKERKLTFTAKQLSLTQTAKRYPWW